MAGYEFIGGDTTFQLHRATIMLVDNNLRSSMDYEVSGDSPFGRLSVGNGVENFSEDIIDAAHNVTNEVFKTGTLSDSVEDFQYLTDTVTVIGLWLSFYSNGGYTALSQVTVDGEILDIIDGNRYLNADEKDAIMAVTRRIADVVVEQ